MENRKNENSGKKHSSRNSRNRNVARGSRHHLVTNGPINGNGHKNGQNNGQNGQQNSDHRAYLPKKARLKMIPLGGVGKICKNMMVYEYDDPLLPNGGDIIIVDMGIAFPDSDMHGIDYLIPDISYLRDRKDKIRGILITHGHEDHMGAIPHLIPELAGVPIFGTRITAGLIERKLSEYKHLASVKVQVIDSEEVLRLGVFRIEPFRVAHSVPESVGYGIHTPYGLIIQTGDFRIDPTPVDGWTTDFEKLEAMCQKAGGALILAPDSTNIDRKGHSLSAKVVDEAFVEAFGQAKGRIIVACFASQIARIQQVMNTAIKLGRKIAISGRSMQNNIEVACKLGYLKMPDDLLIPLYEIDKYPDKSVIIISTGSQGQQYSALVRMSTGDHAQINIKPTDMIILSSSPIPGNEEAIFRMMDDLLRMGPRVIHNEQMEVHVSGHGFYDEIQEMYRRVKPKYYMPVHGDYHHLVANKEMALRNGLPEEKIIMTEDGNVVEIDERGVQVSPKRVPVGAVMVDGLGVGDIGNIVLRDRQAMAQEGLFVIIVTVDKRSGKMMTSPDIISRGFVYMREAEALIQGARSEIKNIVNRHGKGRDEWKGTKETLRDDIGDYLYKGTKRRPMVIPVVIEV